MEGGNYEAEAALQWKPMEVGQDLVKPRERVGQDHFRFCGKNLTLTPRQRLK